jgi:Zn-dependent protease with chaperone function
MSEAEAIREAAELLPWWVEWTSVLICAAVVVTVAWGVSALASWWLRRKLPDPAHHHWTERARLSWPLRTQMGAVMLSLPMVAVVSCVLLLGPVSRPHAGFVPLAVIASVAVAMPASRKFNQALLGCEISRRRWIASAVAVVLGIAAYLALPAGLLLSFVGTSPVLAWVLVADGLIAPLLVARGDILAVYRLLGLLEVAPNRLVRAVDAAAKRTGVRLKSIHLLRWHLANAAAFPWGRQVLFTDTALDVLDDEQLAAVAAHELAHVSEPRWALAIRLIGPMLLVSAPFVAPMMLERRIGLGPGLLVVAAILVVLLVPYRRFARRMEERADKIAHAAIPDARAYAAALERLYERSLIPMVRRSRREAHPDLYDRMIRLRLGGPADL